MNMTFWSSKTQLNVVSHSKLVLCPKGRNRLYLETESNEKSIRKVNQTKLNQCESVNEQFILTQFSLSISGIREKYLYQANTFKYVFTVLKIKLYKFNTCDSLILNTLVFLTEIV